MKTALILSEDPGKSFFFKRQLKGLYSIIEVETKEDAMEWIQSTPIELIFAEMNLLEDDLASFCASVQKETEGKNLPIFLISPVIKQEFAKEVKSLGITEILHEPLDPEELHDTIAQFFSPSILSKRLKTIARKLKPPTLIPRNVHSLSGRAFMRDKTLQTILETKKNAVPLCIFTIQIDMQDRLIKEFGKKGLQELSDKVEALLTNNLRQKDFLITERPCHFLFILPKTSATAGKLIAEELRREISSTPIAIQNTDILLSVSIGILSFSSTHSSAAESFEKFERSLKKARLSLDSQMKIGNIIVSD